MTDVALYERDTDSWAPMLPAINQLAKGIVNTDFVPKALRGKEYAVAACILTGREIGIGPMESLQKIHMIEGKPSLSSELMRSLVLRAGHEIRFTTLTDTKVVIEGRRSGGESWTSVTWTMEDARRIGVAAKDVWKKYPRAMLSNRATSELCRLIFPDALGGISLTPEEIEDEATPAPVVKITRQSSKVQRATVEPVEPTFDEPIDVTDAEIVEDTPEPTEPMFEAEPVAVAAAPDAGTITAGQVKMLSTLMSALGLTTREEVLAYCADVIGHPITTRKELSKSEAHAVIESLTADQAAAGAE